MINRFCKFQGCSSIYTAMVTDFDVPVLSVTVGISLKLHYSAFLHTEEYNAKKGKRDKSYRTYEHIQNMI